MGREQPLGGIMPLSSSLSHRVEGSLTIDATEDPARVLPSVV